MACHSCWNQGKRHIGTHAAQMGNYMRGDENRNLWTYLQVGLLVCTLAIGLSEYSLWEHYVVTRPRARQVEAGRTIPLVSHGVVVYLTQNEKRRLTLLTYVGNGIGLVFVLFSIWKQFLRQGS